MHSFRSVFPGSRPLGLSAAVLLTAWLINLTLTPGLCAASAPNIVLIFVDDLGYGDTRLTNSTSTVATPQIKSIADNGVLFTNAYVASPVCSPSRAGLMTSRHPARYGADSNDSSRARPERVPSTTIASLLQGSAGKNYHTKIIGKWDLAGRAPMPPAYMPIGRGFGAFYGIPSGISSYFRTDGTGPGNAWYFDGTSPQSDGKFTNVNQQLNVKEYVAGTNSYDDRNPFPYLTDKFVDEAIGFISSQTSAAPFFLYLSLNTPHKPYMARDADFQVAAGAGEQRLFNAMIANLDYNVGRVLSQLQTQGIANNTVVIFASDNGAEGKGSSGALTGGKQTLFEGGIRTPFALKWPATFGTSGVTFTKAVTMLDILPTLAVAAGYATAQLTTEGRDLTPYILGTDTSNPHPELCWRYVGDDNNAALLAVRSGDYKYIREVTQSGTLTEHLYNLAASQQEAPGNNLAANPSYATTKSSLVSALNTWNRANALDESFDSGVATGFVPYNSTTAPAGVWSVTNSKLKITGGRAGDRSIAEMTYFDNATIEADVTLKQDGKAGLVFRSSKHSSGALNFEGYYATLESDDNVRLVKVVNGVGTTLQNVALPIALDTAYHLKVVASTNSIKVYVDGVIRIDVVDGSHSGGSVGARVGAVPGGPSTTTATFDDLKVTPL